MRALELTPVGDSVGVILPMDAPASLHLVKGDAVDMTGPPDGDRITGATLRAKQMTAAREIVKRHRDTLADRAKTADGTIDETTLPSRLGNRVTP